jgi:RecA-family ATPase
MMQLAIATALERTWMGVAVMGGPVVFLSAEDDEDELHRRLDVAARHEGVGLDALKHVHLISLAGKDAILAAPNERRVIQPTERWFEFRNFVRSVQAKLVVYDPLADLFAGNENARPEARQFVGILRSLTIETDSTSVLLAHPSLTGMANGTGTSGSTAWQNSVRARLYLDRIREDGKEPYPDARVLRTMKNNYGPNGGEIHLRWQQGVFVSDGNAQGGGSGTDTRIEAIFLDLLAMYADTGRNVSDTPGKTYAPAQFALEEQGRAIGKKALEGAMRRLLQQRRIRVVEHGSPSRRRRHLEV